MLKYGNFIFVFSVKTFFIIVWEQNYMGLEDLRGFQKIDLLFLKILIEIRGLFKMEIFFQKMRLCVGQFFSNIPKS